MSVKCKLVQTHKIILHQVCVSPETKIPSITDNYFRTVGLKKKLSKWKIYIFFKDYITSFYSWIFQFFFFLDFHFFLKKRDTDTRLFPPTTSTVPPCCFPWTHWNSLERAECTGWLSSTSLKQVKGEQSGLHPAASKNVGVSHVRACLGRFLAEPHLPEYPRIEDLLQTHQNAFFNFFF